MPADQALRELEHALRAAPGDAALARRYRDRLRRHGASPERLDRLQGVLALTCDGETGPRRDPAPNHWRRVAVGELPLLPPEPPPTGPLVERWSAAGVLRYLAAGVALIQTPTDRLEARRADSGALLWHVDPELPADPETADWARETDRERQDALGWVVAPWGAARLTARFERDRTVRRVGRHTSRGRVTEREVVDHGEPAVEVALQLLVVDGDWSRVPEALTYWAGTGEPLADSDCALEDFHDELIALSLDPRSPQLALRWRDASQDWTVLSVTGGAGLSSAAGPAGWSAEPPDDPFAAPPAAPSSDADRLAAAALASAETHGLAASYDWPVPLADLLEGRRLCVDGPGSRDKDASLLVADQRLWLQTDRLTVWEAA